MLLQGKNAIVTGGSKGIGRAIVEKFLKQGANVYYISRSEGTHLAEYQALAQASGAKVVFKQADVSEEERITAVIKEIIDEVGKVDIVVNNAGITRDKIIFGMSTEDWETVLKVNLQSAFFICKAISRHMIKNKGGSIINMTSIVGVRGNAGQSNYSASKAGLIGLTKSLALELGGKGIRVNAIAPGFIETEMTEGLSDEVKEKYAANIPMKRMGRAEEIADVSLWLASDLSTYCTGQVIGADGGMGI